MSRRQLDNLSPDAARILRIWERSRPHAVEGADASRADSGSGWKRWRRPSRWAGRCSSRAGLDPPSAEDRGDEGAGVAPRCGRPCHAGGVGAGDSRLGPANAANVASPFSFPEAPALRAGRANHVAHIAGVAKPVALHILILKERQRDDKGSLVLACHVVALPRTAAVRRFAADGSFVVAGMGCAAVRKPSWVRGSASRAARFFQNAPMYPQTSRPPISSGSENTASG